VRSSQALRALVGVRVSQPVPAERQGSRRRVPQPAGQAQALAAQPEERRALPEQRGPRTAEPEPALVQPEVQQERREPKEPQREPAECRIQESVRLRLRPGRYPQQ
jgi:hypothetical protein